MIRIAVITPYFDEPVEMLRQCHESVRVQTYPCTHFLVADGSHRPEVLEWQAEHLSAPGPHGDNGNTPRGFGSMAAASRGFDAIAYLDADNWFFPTHVETMLKLHERTKAAVCTATRNFHRMDGSFMYTDLHASDGVNHVDTSCLFLTREAFAILPLWTSMPRELSPICDRVIWDAIRARGYSRAHSLEPTVAFRTRYQIHYANLGETAPAGSKTNEESTGKAFDWWNSLPATEREGWIRHFSGQASSAWQNPASGARSARETGPGT